MQSVASIPTGKGRTCPRRQCKVGPQAVYGKSSSPEAPVFSRKTLHSRDTHLLMPVGMEPTGSTKHNYKNGKNESQRG